MRRCGLLVSLLAPPVVALLVATGCRSGGFRGGAAKGEAGVLRLALSNAATTLDPAKVQDVETGPILAHVYETLVDYDAQNRIVPRLAKSFAVEAGGTAVRFTLDDAKFSSGRAVTSLDVKRSWERALSPAVASPVAATYLGDIVGAKAIASGEATKPPALAVDTPDAKTLVVHLAKPAGAFLGKLTYPAAAVVDVEACGGGEIVKPAQAVGSGPFRFGAVEADREVRLDAAATFRGPAPKLRAIVYAVVRDSATRLNMFRQGSLDMLTLDRGQIAGAKGDPKLGPLLRAIERPAVYYLLFNAKAYPPFARPEVRRAVAMAVDRARLTTQVLGSLEPAARWVPPGILPGEPGALPPFDPAGAKALLKGETLPPLDLTVRADNPDAKAVAEAIAGDLKTNLGMDVRPNGLEWGALLKKRNSAGLAFAYLNWSADYVDPQNFLSLLLRSDSGVNYDRWFNPEFDALTARADALSDPAARDPLYLKAEGIVLRELPRLPLYFGRDQVLVAARVKGLRTNALGVMLHTMTEVQ